MYASFTSAISLTILATDFSERIRLTKSAAAFTRSCQIRTTLSAISSNFQENCTHRSDDSTNLVFVAVRHRIFFISVFGGIIFYRKYYGQCVVRVVVGASHYNHKEEKVTCGPTNTFAARVILLPSSWFNVLPNIPAVFRVRWAINCGRTDKNL